MAVRLTWLGHAAFKVEGSRVVLIDPWISGNPATPLKSPEDIDRADVIVVTHSHGDHGLDDAVKIAKGTGAVFVSQYELVVKSGLEKVEPMNIGGFVDAGGTGVLVSLTQAWHTAEVGDPTGVVLRLDGVTIYHTGDTGLFSDMRLIGEMYSPDVMLLPIGGRFTMDEEQAAKAVELVRPKVAIPMHYDTFPLIKADPNRFSELAGKFAKVVILKPGETFEL